MYIRDIELMFFENEDVVLGRWSGDDRPIIATCIWATWDKINCLLAKHQLSRETMSSPSGKPRTCYPKRGIILSVSERRVKVLKFFFPKVLWMAP